MRSGWVAGLALAALVACAEPGAAQQRRWGADYFPNPSVTTHDGRTLRFYDDLIKDRIVLVSFIFTACKDLCPLTTARLTQVEDRLGDILGKSAHFVSITIDPENDTPEKLKAYAESYKTGPGWTFVTGRPEDVRAILHKLGERSKKLSEHRNEVVIGNDTTGEWTRNSVFADLARLELEIRSMDRAWRDQERVVKHNAASNTGYAMSERPGQAMFTKLCAPCHTVAVGDRIGPDLYGVAQRRSKAWLASFIRQPEAMHARKDPDALALAAQFPTVRMPNLGVTATDAGDLIAYLEQETKRVADAPSPLPPARHGNRHHHHHHKH